MARIADPPAFARKSNRRIVATIKVAPDCPWTEAVFPVERLSAAAEPAPADAERTAPLAVEGDNAVVATSARARTEDRRAAISDIACTITSWTAVFAIVAPGAVVVVRAAIMARRVVGALPAAAAAARVASLASVAEPVALAAAARRWAAIVAMLASGCDCAPTRLATDRDAVDAPVALAGIGRAVPFDINPSAEVAASRAMISERRRDPVALAEAGALRAMAIARLTNGDDDADRVAILARARFPAGEDVAIRRSAIARNNADTWAASAAGDFEVDERRKAVGNELAVLAVVIRRPTVDIGP